MVAMSEAVYATAVEANATEAKVTTKHAKHERLWALVVSTADMKKCGVARCVWKSKQVRKSNQW